MSYLYSEKASYPPGKVCGTIGGGTTEHVTRVRKKVFESLPHGVVVCRDFNLALGLEGLGVGRGGPRDRHHAT